MHTIGGTFILHISGIARDIFTFKNNDLEISNYILGRIYQICQKLLKSDVGKIKKRHYVINNE